MALPDQGRFNGFEFVQAVGDNDFRSAFGF
jgi:hypothetical protein